MELHESLHTLGRSQGRELFEDADSLRGALDDYLDEQAASTGDINLLVDAVRLGALRQLTGMVESGADPDRAIAEAGSRLARDRGSADVPGAMWACAVLGYATGKVSEAQVRRYRSRPSSAPSPPSGPPTVLPSGPRPTVSPPAATTGWPSGSQGGYTAPHQSGGARPPSVGQPIGATPYGFGAPPPRKRSLWPILVAAGVALVVVVGGIVALLATSGEDSSDPQAEQSSEVVDDLDFTAINERYRSLGQMVTTGASECADVETASGETEKLECTFPDGTLRLTTYVSEQEVKAARNRTLTDDEGTIVSDVESGAFYAFEPTVADPESTEPAVLYWDSAPGMQSALYTGADGVTAEQLRKAFEATEPMVNAPTGPVDFQMKDLVSRFGIVRCKRIPTEVDGETEESACLRSTRRTWVGQFHTVGDFRRYRQNLFELSREDGFPVQDYWYIDQNGNDRQDADEPEQGKIYGFVEEENDDTAVVYVDDLDCKCYLQMYGKGTDAPRNLYNLLF